MTRILDAAFDWLARLALALVFFAIGAGGAAFLGGFIWAIWTESETAYRVCFTGMAVVAAGAVMLEILDS